MRKVYLDNLPHHKSRIDWKNSIGYNVPFVYDNISGELEITNYFISPNGGKQKYLTIKYKNVDYNISTFYLKTCKLHALLSYKTYELIKPKYKVGSIIKDDKRELQLTGYFVKDVKKDKKYYTYNCLTCGYTDGEISESHLTQYNGCSCCAGKIVVEGINDIPTTAPWMTPYFPCGYDEAKLYTQFSSKKIFLQCPYCKSITKKKIQISNLASKKHLSCKKCSDGYSSISKYFYNLLCQLINNKIINDFEIEKKYNWCVFIIPTEKQVHMEYMILLLKKEKLLSKLMADFIEEKEKTDMQNQLKKLSF